MTLHLKIIYFLNIRNVYSWAYNLLKFKHQTGFNGHGSITHFPETTCYQKQDKEMLSRPCTHGGQAVTRG